MILQVALVFCSLKLFSFISSPNATRIIFKLTPITTQDLARGVFPLPPKNLFHLYSKLIETNKNPSNKEHGNTVGETTGEFTSQRVPLLVTIKKVILTSLGDLDFGFCNFFMAHLLASRSHRNWISLWQQNANKNIYMVCDPWLFFYLGKIHYILSVYWIRLSYDQNTIFKQALLLWLGTRSHRWFKNGVPFPMNISFRHETWAISMIFRPRVGFHPLNPNTTSQAALQLQPADKNDVRWGWISPGPWRAESLSWPERIFADANWLSFL